MDYAPGKELTVAGVVANDGQKTQEDNPYSYPLVKSQELKLWPREARSSWERPEWIDPLYDPASSRDKYGY
jgi:outer membrane lipoprotein